MEEDSSSEKGALLSGMSGCMEGRADEDDEEDFFGRLEVWVRCAELDEEEGEERLDDDDLDDMIDADNDVRVNRDCILWEDRMVPR